MSAPLTFVWLQTPDITISEATGLLPCMSIE